MTPLIAFALGIAPEIARGLAGKQAETVGVLVTDAVRYATGTVDADAARTIVARDPLVAATLHVALAQICAGCEQESRRVELDQLHVRLQGVGLAAHGNTLGRIFAGSSVGPVVVSALVLATFALVMVAAMTRSLPSGSDTMVNLLMGTLSTMSASVVAYWVGSSAGSAAKTDMLFRSQPPTAPSTPVQ